MVHLTVLLITTRRGRHPGRGGHPSRRAGGTCAAGRARGGAGGGLPVAWQNSGRSVAGWETIWQSAQKIQPGRNPLKSNRFLAEFLIER